MTQPPPPPASPRRPRVEQLPQAPDLLWVQPQSLTPEVKSSTSAFVPWWGWGNGPPPPCLPVLSETLITGAAAVSHSVTVHPSAPHSG